MMRRIALALAAACLLMTVNVSYAADLAVGGKAPGLHIGKWIKGDSVDLSKAKADDVYVVEFWATWCGPCRMSIPHMSEMQEHFKDRNVHFVGVSNEEPKVVQSFLKDGGWDAKMRYTVATDKDGETSKDWMQASGQQGIPCAFVVKGDKIKWIGHPMDGLDIQVAEQCGDKKYAEDAKKVAELGEKLQGHITAEEWKDAIKVVDQIIAIRPKDYQVLQAKYMILATKMKDTQAANKVGYDMVTACDDAEMLNAFAWAMLTEDEFEDARDAKLAKTMAKKAVDLTKEKEGAVLDTYARALADSGDITGAVEWQKKAIAATKDNPRMKKELESTLKEYEKKASEGV